MKRYSMKVCVVIPMYNEEAVAQHSIRTILGYTRKLPPVTNILIVNDGSKDGTENIVRQILSEPENEGIQLVSHEENQGYGAALRTGIRFAVEKKYDYILFMDSDLTNHPRYLKTFHERMTEGWDYIKASRYARGGATVGVPWQHRMLSVMGNLLAKVLYRLPLTDLTNGFRAVKVDIVKKMDLKEPGFSIIMEELYHVKYLAKSFCDIPYVLTSRKNGQGKSKFSYGPRTYLRYLKYPVKSLLGA
jgi:glycosyltransferase involved in cell wall biosynthesis